MTWASGRGGTEASKAALRGDIDAFAAELAGPDPTPTERVLADAAAVCWFSLRLAEAQYAGASSSEEGISHDSADYYARRIDGAHRRLISTLRTLATVRRLAGPAVLINQVVGRQQLNVPGRLARPVVVDRHAQGAARNGAANRWPSLS